MEKTTTLNLRVNPDVKEAAEKVLAKLGIPMSTAINMFLNQIVLTESIPFPITLPKTFNAEVITNDTEARIKKYAEAYFDYMKKNKE